MIDGGRRRRAWLPSIISVVVVAAIIARQIADGRGKENDGSFL